MQTRLSEASQSFAQGEGIQQNKLANTVAAQSKSILVDMGSNTEPFDDVQHEEIIKQEQTLEIQNKHARSRLKWQQQQAKVLWNPACISDYFTLSIY